MAIKKVTNWAVHSLFMCSRKYLRSQVLYIFFEQMNNLQTVTRLGVDKFTSRGVVASSIAAACELANTLRLEAEKEEEYFSPFFGTWVTFLSCVEG